MIQTILAVIGAGSLATTVFFGVLCALEIRRGQRARREREAQGHYYS